MLVVSLTVLTAIAAAVILDDLRRARVVPFLEPIHTDAPEPVSVLVPARDEAQRIGRLLDGLAAQTGASFELIVLDDHSSDGTAAVVTARAAELPQLRVLAGAPLPEGWAGKCWACWQAAEASKHAWLLFLDADTAPEPRLVSTLVSHAAASELDLLSVLPLLELGSLAERTLMPPFGGLIQAVFPLDRINDPRSSIALANGQCILVRRDVYFATGGHAAVRDSVLEDVRLAQLIKGAGHRIELVAAPDLLRVRMYTRLSEIAEGLRKNAWAGYSAGGWRSAWGGFRQGALATAPLAVLGAGAGALVLRKRVAPTLLGFGSVLTVITTAYWGYTIKRVYRLHPLWGLLYPFGTIGYFILAALAWVSIKRGAGVRWKGRAYSG